MNLLINMLIEWLSPVDESTESDVHRILWIDAPLTEVITIHVFGKRAFPIKRAYEEITHAIRSNGARILETDPYAVLIRPEEEIKKSHRERRDTAWKLIEELEAVS